MTARRLDAGGRIDRAKRLTLRFDGRAIAAHPGDTLASALLAADVALVGRSFKYHRPRGLLAAGVEEPNALVHLRDGGRHEPNTPATLVEAFDGLTATAQNAWPSLGFDIGAANGLASRFLGAGFYYKTFIGPFRGTRFWMACEGVIRRAAGMGRAITLDDPDSYEKVNGYCDVLIVGAGPAGLAAALAAAQTGADVVLADLDRDFGGSILSTPVDAPLDQWREATLARLRALPNVRLMARTTVFGAYDGGVFGMVERLADHLPTPEQGQPRQRLWVMRAGRAVLATGALERPMVFAGNDRPGVMLASAAAAWLHRYGILSGARIVVSTNNDSAYGPAMDLAQAGAKVTLCDLRPKPTLADSARKAGITLRAGQAVVQTQGRRRVTGVRIAPVNDRGHPTGAGSTQPCDLVLMSGGWAPALHLWSQLFGKPAYHPALEAFLPRDLGGNITCVGSLMAADSFATSAAQGHCAGGGKGLPADLPEVDAPFWGHKLLPVSIIAQADGSTPGKALVDFQHDVKLSDIDQAHREGYVSVEHLKRYTTLGMAADQGKTSNLNALARMAALRGLDLPAVGTTTFRPPFTPVSFGVLVGHGKGLHFHPIRRSPIHDWHLENGAVMTEAGPWMRAWYYPRLGESLRDAYAREAAHVRAHVGMVDVSTLGKIAVQGPDAAEFLNRVYVNGFKMLAVGRLRYGVMLREDGLVLDDGATARLGEHEFFMSTSTANATKVLAMAEHLLQTAWRDLRVQVTSVTDQWAAMAVAGPKSRALLTRVSGADLSAAIMPNNALTAIHVAGIPCRLHRMSFSGELAYELFVPAKSGRRVWEALIAAGREFDLGVYGTEAMGTLRIEKGHVTGAEIEGRTALRDLGLEGMASTKKPYVGSVLRLREGLQDAERPVLVGLKVTGTTGAPAGSLLFSAQGPTDDHGEGWVSSTTWSPALNCSIALGLLARGAERHGETLRVIDFLGNTHLTAEVTAPRFFDPEGGRQNA